jgi:hypothetical protein
MRVLPAILAVSAFGGVATAKSSDATTISDKPLAPALLETVAEALPESPNVDKPFLDPSHEPDAAARGS